MVHLTDNDDNHQRCHGIHVWIFPRKDSTHKIEPEENLGGISWRRSKIFVLVIKLTLIVKSKVISLRELSINNKIYIHFSVCNGLDDHGTRSCSGAVSFLYLPRW